MKRAKRGRWACVMAALAASAGCGEGVDPSSPADVAFARGGNRPISSDVRIRRIELDGDVIVLEGAPRNFSFDVTNNSSDLALVTVDVHIVQGAVSRQAASFPAHCPPSGAGGLPQGPCTMTAQLTASNAAPGTGELVPGGAQLLVTIRQLEGGVETVLATKFKGIDVLGSGPSITDLQIESSTLVLDGPNISYTVTLENPGVSALSEVFLQGYLVQGDVIQGAGGVNVLCEPDLADAVLPVGECTLVWSARAISGPAQGGVLSPGPAEFVLTLNQGFFVTPIELDRDMIPVTLVSLPTITSVTLDATTVEIGGARIGYEFTASNPAPYAITGLTFQGAVVQGGVSAPTGGVVAHCPDPDGILPPGDCTMSFTMGASNAGASGGILVVGPAEFVLTIFQSVGQETVAIGHFSVPIDLVATP